MENFGITVSTNHQSLLTKAKVNNENEFQRIRKYWDGFRKILAVDAFRACQFDV